MTYAVSRLIQTCSACPSQWKGETADKRQLYIRYRWGWLWACVGEQGDDDEFAAINNGQDIFSKDLGDEFDGFMPESEMKEVLKDVLDFSLIVDSPRTDSDRQSQV